MKLLNTLFLIALLLTTIVSLVSSQDESPPAPKRSNLLNLRRPAGRNNVFGKTTTTTQAPAPVEEDYPEEANGNEEFADGEYDDNENKQIVEEEVTTTTEAVKKVGPIIRPFRSNDDLLNALKRRQLNNKSVKKVPSVNSETVESHQQEQKQNDPSAAHASISQSKSSAVGNRKRFGNARSPISRSSNNNDSPSESTNSDDTTQPPPNRLGRSRFALNRNIRS